HQAIEAHHRGDFHTSNNEVLSFGIGAEPVWLRVEVMNPQPHTLSRHLSLQTSWLDRINVCLLNDEKLITQHQLGDKQPFSQRADNSRFFNLELAFPPGYSSLYLRIETPDPMVIPIYLDDHSQYAASQIIEQYSYGILYGGLFALFAYNLMLFFSLKNNRYLYYSLYLAAFILMNISYTGHGYKWLWPDSPQWQQWSNPTLMLLFTTCGLMFATRFLKTAQHFPRIHRVILIGTGGFIGAELLAVLFNSQVTALLLSFSFVFLFSITMVLLGIISLLAGNKSAKYFLLASVIHVIGSSITALTVWGLVPYHQLAYRAVDIGIMIDAILLAMALADQFRIAQEKKILAEKLARIDPLTGLKNRLAFHELVNPLWSIGLRNQRNMSLVMFDVDRFKSVNDLFGHSTGDQVLCAIASVLNSGSRAGDILARWGGEEFILFLPETDLISAIDIAGRLRSNIGEIRQGKQQVAVTVSAGIAHIQREDASLEGLINAADRQLYEAKRLGRNRICSIELS
ncbi:MAG: GGDEF domain-containing protein, partial [Gammaproteobacteria bacterium]|nr:GGDEF domain-containing protein [Gammaproteobacteria bacterium]